MLVRFEIRDYMQNIWKKKMLYSSFRPLYLCTFASDKSCLTETHRKSQNLRPLPSHYLTLWEKLTSSLFLMYSYFNIGFYGKTHYLCSSETAISEMSVSQIAKWKDLGYEIFGRTEEIASLREIRRTSKDNAQFTVVTGRRRVGKTYLIWKAYEDEPILYFKVRLHLPGRR